METDSKSNMKVMEVNFEKNHSESASDWQMPGIVNICDLKILEEKEDDMCIDLKSTKTENINEIESDTCNGKNGGNAKAEIHSDDEYLEILQECPVCHKMFVRKDYEKYHIYTHKPSEQTDTAMETNIDKNADVGKADLNANDVFEGFNSVVNSDFSSKLQMENTESNHKSTDTLKQEDQDQIQSNNENNYEIKKCPKCSEMFFGDDNLVNHLKIHRNDEVEAAVISEVKKACPAIVKDEETVMPTVKEEAIEEMESTRISSNNINSDDIAGKKSLNEEEFHKCLYTGYTNEENTVGKKGEIKTDVANITMGISVDSKLDLEQKHCKLKDLLECPVCYMTVDGEQEFKLHMKTHDNETERLYGSKRKQALQEKLTLMEMNLKECHICYRLVAGKYRLDIHMKTHHTDIAETVENLSAQDSKLSVQEKLVSMNKNLFHCPTCFKLVTGQSQLDEHKKTHSSENVLEQEPMQWMVTLDGNELHECPICCRIVSGKHRLEYHMKTHSSKKERSANKKKIPEKKQDAEQKRVSLGNEPHKCSKCSKIVAGEHRLKQHMKTHSYNMETGDNLEKSNERGAAAVSDNRDKLQCPVCHKWISGSHRYMLHTESHSSSMPDCTSLIECMICQKSLSKKHLIRHMQSVHALVRPFKCPVCSMTFTRRDGLKRHHQRVHNKQKFPCAQCGKSFPTKEYLLKHVNRHDNTMNFSCIDCGKTFVTERGLSKHSELHHRTKEHVCEECGKAYLHKYNLTRHLQAHKVARETKGKTDSNYSCKKCGKRFMSRYNWKRHVAVHRHENTLLRSNLTTECAECGKTFMHKRNLKRHIKTHMANSLSCNDDNPMELDDAHPSSPSGEPKSQTQYKTNRFENTRSVKPKFRPTLIPHKLEKTRSVKPMYRPTLIPCKPDRLNDISSPPKNKATVVADKYEKLKDTSLQSEVKADSPTRKSNCRICGKPFNNKFDLIQHLKVHS